MAQWASVSFCVICFDPSLLDYETQWKHQYNYITPSYGLPFFKVTAKAENYKIETGLSDFTNPVTQATQTPIVRRYTYIYTH